MRTVLPWSAACTSTGTSRSRWTTASSCAPTSSARIGIGRIPVILSYGPYGKGLHFEDGYPDQWRIMCAPTRTCSPDPQPVPGLGGRRPREMGSARLRVRSGRFARGRRSPGFHRTSRSPRDAGLLRLHRMGRGAALEQRQGRAERNLLLRDEPVAGRGATAAVSGGALRLGRVPPTGTATRPATAASSRTFWGELVRASGEDRAVRARRARPQGAA